MAEYIERAAFVGELTAAETQKELRNMTSADAYFAVLRMVNELHKADVAPVRHGRWEKAVESKLDTHTGEYWEEEYYNCLKCDYASDRKSPYCPNCGAKMDADE